MLHGHPFLIIPQPSLHFLGWRTGSALEKKSILCTFLEFTSKLNAPPQAATHTMPDWIHASQFTLENTCFAASDAAKRFTTCYIAPTLRASDATLITLTNGKNYLAGLEYMRSLNTISLPRLLNLPACELLERNLPPQKCIGNLNAPSATLDALA